MAILFEEVQMPEPARLPKPIQLQFTDEQLENYPSYSWPLKCCWCGSGLGATVRAPEVDSIKFGCGLCGKHNCVRRVGNTVIISPPQTRMPIGCFLILMGAVAYCVFKYLPIHVPAFTFPPVAGYLTFAARWTGYIAGLLMLLGLARQIPQWHAVKKLYGRFPVRLVWQIGVYSRKNRTLRIQIVSLAIMFCMFFVPILFIFVGSNLLGILEPFNDVAMTLRVPALLIFFWQLERVIRFAIPPSALFLGTAKSVNVHLIAVLNKELYPYRVVSLLDVKEHIFPLFVSDVMFNNFRTVNGHEWRTVVHHLMDVVPLIIVDTAVRTEYVDAEQQRIERFAYTYKVVQFSSKNYGKEINADQVDVEVVVRAAKALGEEIIHPALHVLHNASDIERRWKSQLEHTAMLRAVPYQVRYHGDINAMLIKAHFILAWVAENFLRDCKQLHDGDKSLLLEDIPSRVNSAEETGYLRNSLGLDEAVGISLSALDLALQTPGPSQQFNIANAHTKVGKCARFIHNWSTALNHLGIAIQSLTEMSHDKNCSSNSQIVCKELADAFFLRGEVFMLRFRQTRSFQDRSNAIDDFQAAALLDNQLGNDATMTTSRLNSLRL